MADFVLPITDGARAFSGASPWEATAALKVARDAGFIPPPLDTIAEGAPPAVAYINLNRLAADCPDGCGAGALVWRDGPHVFMCPQCLNGAIGYRWRRVVLPDDLAAIEAALLARPLPQNRNWSPGEAIDDLLRENAEHGV
jgi:hypothetical protein